MKKENFISTYIKLMDQANTLILAGHRARDPEICQIWKIKADALIKKAESMSIQEALTWHPI